VYFFDRQDNYDFMFPQRSACGRIEGLYGNDFFIVQFDADRQLKGEREDINDTSPPGEISFFICGFLALVAEFHKPR
jgi:hypothetical protein